MKITSPLLRSIRTPGGHQRFNVSNLLGNKTDASLTVAYARVSSHDRAKRGTTRSSPKLLPVFPQIKSYLQEKPYF